MTTNDRTLRAGPARPWMTALLLLSACGGDPASATAGTTCSTDACGSTHAGTAADGSDDADATTAGDGTGCAGAACPGTCGDATCSADETCASCPADCGDCPQGCGDTVCDGDETCTSCPADCGACMPECGDGTCGDNDHCSTCPEDCGTCSGVAPEIVRGPYLQVATPESMIVRWRTAEPTASTVAYGPSAENLAFVASDDRPVVDHEVRIDGLSPGGEVVYAIGTPDAELVGGTAPDWETRTPPTPGTVEQMRVWVIGDSGDPGDDANAVRDAYAQLTGATRTDFWLMLGDNAYDDGTDAEYQAAVFDTYPDMLRRSPVWATIGNHDAHTDSGAPYYDIFTLPTRGEAGGMSSGTEAYYSFDWANAHFVCLDSEAHSDSTAMSEWLLADLEASDATWTIAFWHHPPYTKGSHDSDAEGQLVDMREIFVPVLEEHGVDLVLTGHSHSYERSYLLNGHYDTSDTLTSDMIVDEGDGSEKGDGAYEKPMADSPGAVYIVAGSSAKTSSMEPSPHAAMLVSLEILGSVALDIAGPRLDVTFIDDQGELVDVFTILK